MWQDKMRGKSSQRGGALSTWTKLFPYIGVLALVGLNFLFIYNVRGTQDTNGAKPLKQSDESVANDALKSALEDMKERQMELERKNAEMERLHQELKAKVEGLRNDGGSNDGSESLSKRSAHSADELDPSVHSSVEEMMGKNIKKMLDELDDKGDIMTLASDWLHAKIDAVQNPTDCSNAKWHLCRVFNNCGGGCVIHQTSYCFLVGLALNRITHIGDGWRYLRECGTTKWDCAFQPVSRCPYPNSGDMKVVDSIERWDPNADSDKLVTTTELFSRGPGARFVRWAASDGFHTNTSFWLPPEIEKVRSVHGDVRPWVVGHIEQYMLRLNEETNSELMKRVENVKAKFEHPVVGIHIRRTDHEREAPFRSVEEYLGPATKWFEDNNVPVGQRKIYLATDETKVVTEAKQNHPDFEWLTYEYAGNPSGFTKDSLDHGRSSMDGFYSLMADWYFLRRVDFMVGTHSSQVGRMAYELMQNYHVDASQNFKSLDDPWYFP
eukprot:TRINITY_DN5616_c0_g2_i1.p1 TRINITY_DN5616_c0_g2~~TRINITY_DN5616_c0_g2_i1.p1  ORF type:complete len:495 (+),score=94.59 TRINITY_DN5616_c0_g2_i1:42-1526(+)